MSTRAYQKKVKSWSKVLEFDQWKKFCENFKPIRVWLWFVYKIPESNCFLQLFGELIQIQKKYPTSLDNVSTLTWWLPEAATEGVL